MLHSWGLPGASLTLEGPQQVLGFPWCDRVSLQGGLGTGNSGAGGQATRRLLSTGEMGSGGQVTREEPGSEGGFLLRASASGGG